MVSLLEEGVESVHWSLIPTYWLPTLYRAYAILQSDNCVLQYHQSCCPVIMDHWMGTLATQSQSIVPTLGMKNPSYQA